MEDAVREGIFSLNHRSSEFVSILKSAVNGLKQKLHIPESYEVYFISSATECWEIIAESFIQEQSAHIFNGAFGQKWFLNTGKLGCQTESFQYKKDQIPLTNSWQISPKSDLICITHNETSNGTYFPQAMIAELKTQYPDKLIAVDATSSMAGINLDFALGDIWFSSVQKCFGLPTGMAIMVCSPKAIERGLTLQNDIHYNGFINLHHNALKSQTTHTPNTMNIYLLHRVMENVPSIIEIDKTIRKRAKEWYKFLEDFTQIGSLVENDRCRSQTVIAVQADENMLNKIKNEARQQDILLGRGYGEWLNKTFRIANFPAIHESEIIKLKNFLHQFK